MIGLGLVTILTFYFRKYFKSWGRPSRSGSQGHRLCTAALHLAEHRPRSQGCVGGVLSSRATCLPQAGEIPAPPPAAPCLIAAPITARPWKLGAHQSKSTRRDSLRVTTKGAAEPSSGTAFWATTSWFTLGKAVCTASGCDHKFNTKSNLKGHHESRHENRQKPVCMHFRRMWEGL